jgi:hypothetical protein
MKTNSKQVKEAIKQHILECVYDENEKTFATFDEAREHLKADFERVAGTTYYLKKFPNPQIRFPTAQERFNDYLMGLPFWFEFESHKIVEFLNGLGINTQGKSFNTKKSANLYTYLIFKEL